MALCKHRVGLSKIDDVVEVEERKQKLVLGNGEFGVSNGVFGI